VTLNNNVRLELSQRHAAEELAEEVAQEPLVAAFELIALREAARLARTIEWVAVDDNLPKCSKDRNALGVEVLVWPRDLLRGCDAIGATAFYGRRATGRGYAAFYKYGAVIDGITHWAYLPDGPA
jgi:hypothetical protein